MAEKRADRREARLGERRQTKTGRARPARGRRAVKVHNAASKLGVLQSECGTTHVIWRSPRPRPVVGFFANLGICSIEVTIAGLGQPQVKRIPSRAGWPGQILGHPAATQIQIECLSNVPGGDCTVMFVLTQ